MYRNNKIIKIYDVQLDLEFKNDKIYQKDNKILLNF